KRPARRPGRNPRRADRPARRPARRPAAVDGEEHGAHDRIAAGARGRARRARLDPGLGAEAPLVSAAGSYRAVGVAMALTGVACFSLRPILIKLAYAYVVDPVTLLALRMLFSLPFFVAAAAWAGRGERREPVSRRDAGAIVFLGFIGYYFSSFVDFLGLQYISAGLGRLILFLYPTIVVLLSLVFLRKRP